MIPVPQRICASGNDNAPDGAPQIPGDCVKCCVASILELPYEDVPHFVAGDVVNPNLCEDGTPHPNGPFKTDWYGGLIWWLKNRGYACRVVHTSYFKNLDCMMAWRTEIDRAGLYSPRNMLWMYDARDCPPWHPGYWVASVISENFAGCTHAIVMKNGEVAFDPSPRPRRTPYQYVGEMLFTVEDPAVCRVVPRVVRAADANALPAAEARAA